MACIKICHFLFNENYFLECKFVRARIDNITNYINDDKPDILQEIKIQDENFPYENFENIGYSSYTLVKSYNGVQ